MKRGALFAVSIVAWAWIAWWLGTGFGWLLGLVILAGLIAFCWWVTLPVKAKE